jgi:hypothetical protein
MPTECSPDLFGFEPVEGRAVVAAFDAGAVTSDAGAAHDQAGRLRSSCVNRARSSSASPWRLKLRGTAGEVMGTARGDEHGAAPA